MRYIALKIQRHLSLKITGVPRTFGGISRNPRPLAPARPHRAGRLHVVPVTHAHGGGSGVRGNEDRADMAQRLPSARDGRAPQYAAVHPRYPRASRVGSETYKPWSGSCSPPLPPPWLIHEGRAAVQTVQGQFVHCGHR